MTPQAISTSIAAENAPKASMLSLLAGHFIGAGFDFDECEPIGNGGFNMLMALVAVATLAFGCIVNGWLL
jgi:hypothetical protein